MGVVLFFMFLGYTVMMLGLYPHFHMETITHIKDTLSTNYESSLMRIEEAGADLTGSLKYHYDHGIEGLEAIGNLLHAGYQDGWSQVQELCHDVCPNLDSWRESLYVTSQQLSHVKDVLGSEIFAKFDTLHKIIDRLCETVVHKIDSPDFDWLDLYRPYSTTGHHVSRCNI
jgi:hypothetical protein